jgi:hypothetical protein
MKISKKQMTDFIITILQWYVATILLIYGTSKIIGQSGISHEDAVKPIIALDRFHVMMYLFMTNKLFSVSVGLVQVLGSVLLLIPRTKLIGALTLLPVLVTIFILNLCFSREVFGWLLVCTIFDLLLADLLILYYSRMEICAAWMILTASQPMHFLYRWWWYLIMPPLAMLINYFVPRLMSWPVESICEFLSHHFNR